MSTEDRDSAKLVAQELTRIAERALDEASRLADEFNFQLVFKGPVQGFDYIRFPLEARYFPKEAKPAWESSTDECERQDYRGHDLTGWCLNADVKEEYINNE